MPIVRLDELEVALGKGATLDISSWFSIGLVCLAGASSPGPSLAVLVKNTVAGGRRQGVLTGIGHGLGVGIYAFAAVVGVAALVQTVPGVSRTIEVVGGVYLVWMGLGVLRHAGEGDEEVASVDGRTGFQEGFAIAFLNPKIAVFFLALLGSFLPPDASTLELVGVACLAMGIDAAWYVFAALMLVTTGAADWLAARRLWMDRILGIVLLGVGVFLVAA
ncbi:MAG: LysE family translocator [Myxococcota bacterium]|nr:LysE family translocator [Myxococcota bacterium]